MGLLIYFLFVILFIYGYYLSYKNKVSNVFVGIAFVLMIFEFIAVLGESSYTGYPIEHFSVKGMYYIGVLFYYIGYFIWSIIALLLVYIPILVNKKKFKNQQKGSKDTEKEDEQPTQLIDKLEDNDVKDEQHRNIMYCVNCGKETGIEDKYCKYCGKKILNDNQKNSVDRVKNDNSALSMKYYDFFKKWYLPFIVIINLLIIISNLLNFESMDLIVLLIIDVILYLALPIKLISVLEKKEKFGFFLLIIFFILDYIVKVLFGTINFFENDSENGFFIYAIILIVIYGIWFVPNMIYFVKRRYLFINE